MQGAGWPYRVSLKDAHYRGGDECIYGAIYRAIWQYCAVPGWPSCGVFRPGRRAQGLSCWQQTAKAVYLARTLLDPYSRIGPHTP